MRRLTNEIMNLSNKKKHRNRYTNAVFAPVFEVGRSVSRSVNNIMHDIVVKGYAQGAPDVQEREGGDSFRAPHLLYYT